MPEFSCKISGKSLLFWQFVEWINRLKTMIIKKNEKLFKSLCVLSVIDIEILIRD